MPGIVPAEALYAGDDWSRSFTIKQSGTAVDLVAAGWSAWAAQWRASAGTAANLVMTVDATHASTGVLVLALTGAQTEQMAGPGGWDLQGTIGGKTSTILVGSFTWTQDFTR